MAAPAQWLISCEDDKAHALLCPAFVFFLSPRHAISTRKIDRQCLYNLELNASGYRSLRTEEMRR